MKTRTLHRTYRALSRVFYTGSIALLIASLVLNFIPMQPVMAGNSGSIWTTDDSCTPQNLNHYDRGAEIWLRADGFGPNDLITIKITGQPGNSSGDPGDTVSEISATPNATGYFCVKAYTVAEDEKMTQPPPYRPNVSKTLMSDNRLLR